MMMALSFSMHLLILCFCRMLEALKGIIYASSECFRAKSFQEPAPPAWGEDEFSAILDAASGRINGSAGDVRFHLHAQWQGNVQADLVFFGVDLFDLEEDAPGTT